MYSFAETQGVSSVAYPMQRPAYGTWSGCDRIGSYRSDVVKGQASLAHLFDRKNGKEELNDHRHLERKTLVARRENLNALVLPWASRGGVEKGQNKTGHVKKSLCWASCDRGGRKDE